MALAGGCGCKKLSNGPCSQGLSAEDVSNYRLAIRELESSEVDLAILAQLLSCSIHFMLVGHTRFSPDQYFGMIKRNYRKTRVSSISQLSKVVSESTDTGMNQVQLAFNKESGYRVPLYDWKSFLSS